MKILREHLHCPHCHQQELQTSALTCLACDLEIKAQVEDNEFSRLGEEDLHFLRVFVHSEGKLKDVEKALGLSYPTVKNKLQQLKKTLLMDHKLPTPKWGASEILERMHKGELGYEEGLKLLKELSQK